MIQTSPALTEFLHGHPSDTVTALDSTTSPDGRWVLAAALGAVGRYGESLAMLATLAEAPTPYASLACSTAASHYRQLGRHGEAYELDARALARAHGHQPAEFDALLGLAADAVGAADAAVARVRLAAAAAVAAGWRCTVRTGWVATEIALLTGDAPAAVRVARPALATAEAAAAPRHVAKCLLFLGVSEHVAGDERAHATLTRASAAARALDALPLRWVAEAVLAELPAADPYPHLAAAADAIRRIAEGLGPDDRARWMGRPDLAAVLSRAEGFHGGRASRKPD